MLRDRYAPVDLFALVPDLALALEPVLARLEAAPWAGAGPGHPHQERLPHRRAGVRPGVCRTAPSPVASAPPLQG